MFFTNDSEVLTGTITVTDLQEHVRQVNPDKVTLNISSLMPSRNRLIAGVHKHQDVTSYHPGSKNINV